LDNTQENTLLSVKSWTYLIFVLPAGFLADKISPKAMISFMGLNYAFWTFVSPYSYFNFYALFVTLFMAGISEVSIQFKAKNSSYDLSSR
jgi:MFS family permease